MFMKVCIWIINKYKKYINKIMRNNKQLYESIMRDVSKIIKKSLNEGINNSEEYEDLLTYIYDNRSFANYDIKAALGAMEEERIPLNVADHNIY